MEIDMQQDLTTFDFETQAVRTVTIDGAPWFVGKDVCAALDLADHHQALARLDEDEIYGGYNVPTIKGARETKVISEPGVYRLIFTSRTEAADRFKRWLAHEVLPALRKTGRYALAGTSPAPAQGEIDWEKVQVSLNMVNTYRQVHGKRAAAALMKQLPLPQIEDLDIEDAGAAQGPFLAFAAERLIASPGAETSSSAIYRAYEDWARDGDRRVESHKALSCALTASGVAKHMRNGRMVFVNVALRDLN
jgi:prophage antirepressor-like protein